jgi:capsular exopolysaccharide synthesis family protein
MSLFFDALEQAERDRLREEQAAKAASPPAQAPTAPPPVREEQAAKTASPPAQAPTAPPPVRGQQAAKTASPPAQAPTAPPPVRGQQAAKTASPPAQAPTAPPPVMAPAGESRVENEPVPYSKFTHEPSARPLPRATTTPVFRPSLRTPERRWGIRRRNHRPPLLIAVTDPGSMEADAYRTVRANIESLSEQERPRVVAVTSAIAGEGKSTTAANLAVIAAQGGRSVCLVDADFRHPTLHAVFGLENVGGLASALEHGTPLKTAARASDVANLSVVVAGRGTQEGFHDVLTTHRLQKVIRESEAAYDLIIFDGPPVVPVADAVSLAAVCDGVILVLRAGRTPLAAVQRAITQIRQVHGRVLGVLLNEAHRGSDGASSYQYHRAYDKAPSE